MLPRAFVPPSRLGDMALEIAGCGRGRRRNDAGEVTPGRVPTTDSVSPGA